MKRSINKKKATLTTDDNGAYTKCIQDVSIMDTEVRLELGKDRLGKDSKEETPDKPAKPQKTQTHLDDVSNTVSARGTVNPTKSLTNSETNGR